MIDLKAVDRCVKQYHTYPKAQLGEAAVRKFFRNYWPEIRQTLELLMSAESAHDEGFEKFRQESVARAEKLDRGESLQPCIHPFPRTTVYIDWTCPNCGGDFYYGVNWSWNRRKPESLNPAQSDIERCNQEIARCEEEINNGKDPFDEVLLGLRDWSEERRRLEAGLD